MVRNDHYIFIDAKGYSLHPQPKKGDKKCFKYKNKYSESNLFLIAQNYLDKGSNILNTKTMIWLKNVFLICILDVYIQKGGISVHKKKQHIKNHELTTQYEIQNISNTLLAIIPVCSFPASPHSQMPTMVNFMLIKGFIIYSHISEPHTAYSAYFELYKSDSMLYIVCNCFFFNIMNLIFFHVVAQS